MRSFFQCHIYFRSFIQVYLHLFRLAGIIVASDNNTVTTNRQRTKVFRTTPALHGVAALFQGNLSFHWFHYKLEFAGFLFQGECFSFVFTFFYRNGTTLFVISFILHFHSIHAGRNFLAAAGQFFVVKVNFAVGRYGVYSQQRSIFL